MILLPGPVICEETELMDGEKIDVRCYHNQACGMRELFLVLPLFQAVNDSSSVFICALNVRAPSMTNVKPMVRPNAAIFFADDAYLTDRPKLMGRQSAGEGFLKGFVSHSGVAEFRCVTGNASAANSFAELCRGWGASGRRISRTPLSALAALSDIGTLYLPGPMLAEMSWRRRRSDSRGYSLFGITHTISSHGAIDSLADMLAAPVEPWDAIVCTSQPVLDATRRLLDAEGERLAERFCGKKPPLPQLALVPLGVDSVAMAPNDAKRTQWRQKLGIPDDDVVFLFVGRLSFHAKANPYPMLVAAERAARETGKGVHLIQAGWFANAAIESAFRESAKALCPSVFCHFLDGRESEVRTGIWHAADVFVSLSDNIQETFGLTPVEAMAAGLPCIVSDWNGYRDTVRDGVDGFRIPTVAPCAGLGVDLAARHEDGVDNYDRYIGLSSLFVAVDVESTAQAFVRLAGDRNLRARMSACALERARQEFDWSVIVRRYQEIWSELSTIRCAAKPGAIPGIANPRRADPYWFFAEYPTHALVPGDRIELVSSAGKLNIQYLLGQCPITSFGQELVLTAKQCEAIVQVLAEKGPVTAEAISKLIDPQRPLHILRALVYLAKLGLVRVVWNNGQA